MTRLLPVLAGLDSWTGNKPKLISYGVHTLINVALFQTSPTGHLGRCSLSQSINAKHGSVLMRTKCRHLKWLVQKLSAACERGNNMWDDDHFRDCRGLIGCIIHANVCLETVNTGPLICAHIFRAETPAL